MSPPDPPRRGKLPSATDEPNVSRGPHTPIPGHDQHPTEPPPQAMPMPPPRGYEGPRARLGSRPDDATLVGLAPPAERRPSPANPPPPESMRPRVAERSAEPSEPPPGNVIVGKGKLAISVPSAVALALITCLGGAFTAWINKPSPGDPAAIAAAIRGEMDAIKEDRKTELEALTKRVGDTEGELKLLNLSVQQLNNRVTDKLNQLYPPPVDQRAAPMSDRLKR